MNFNKRMVFSDLVNNTSFPLLVPEYYNVNVSDYFKKEMKGPPPIVNGQQVTWEEYLEREGAVDENEYFIPDPLYVGEDMNCTYTSKSPAGIVDLVVNNVPFKFEKFDDIASVIAILDGYVEEVTPYLVANPDLQIVLDNVSQTRLKLTNYQTSVLEDREMKGQNGPKRPLSIADLLKFVR